MKLPITDKFLWDIYNVTYPTVSMIDFILNPRAIKFMSGSQNPVFEKYRKEKGKVQFNRFIYKLKRNNYITSENIRGKKAFMVTKGGMDKILKGRCKRKEGKWIMVIFDIPEKYKKSRNLLRSVLSNLGYKIFQHSVWVTPYDVSEKTEKLLQHYSLDNFVKIFLIEKI